jgi:hypothetical protein
MPKTTSQSATALSDKPDRRKTPVRIVNLKQLDNSPKGLRRWEELPAEYKSSADAIKGHAKLGEGGFQVAHLFGAPKRYKYVQPPRQLVPDDGAPEAAPADGSEEPSNG